MSRIHTVLASLVAFLTTVAASAAVLEVDPDGSGDHVTIQAAIDAAANGDVILIAPGSYDEFLDTAGKTLTLRGANGASQTAIDPTGDSGVLLTAANAESGLRVENLTFRNGRGASMVSLGEDASATFVACRFIGGIAADGAALSMDGATATFENCEFISNQASARGGAIKAANSTLEFENCAFTSNQCSGSEGGALHLTSCTMTLDACEFISNRCHSGGTSHGGVIWANGLQGSWSECEFRSNQATASDGARGGDAYLLNATIEIEAGTFESSLAAVSRSCSCGFVNNAEGGALYCGSGTMLGVYGSEFMQTRADAYAGRSNGSNYSTGNSRARGGAVVFVDGGTGSIRASMFFDAIAKSRAAGGCCVYFANANAYGGAIFVSGASPLLEACTFTDGRSEIQRSGAQTGTQIAYGAAIYLESLASPTILFCTFENGATIDNGNVSGQGAAIYSTGQSSPFLSGCAFIGNASGDAGAYYSNDSSPSFAACLFQQNSGGAIRSVGSGGYFPQVGGSTFCGNTGGNINGTWFDNEGNAFVNECGADCNGNGLDDAYEIATETATDCNGNGALDACEIEATPALDCNGNGTLDACESTAGNDCDGDGILNSCESDCNKNGLPDDCEILAGNGTDCDGDGTLDSCQIAADPSIDCNGNGLPDSCDGDCDGDGAADSCQIAADPGLDCDGNGVLDSCEMSGADINNNDVLDACEGLQLTGVSIEVAPITGVLRTATSPLPLSAVCYRIYATFSSPNAQVVGVFGAPDEGPLRLEATDGFYNDPMGGNTASNRPCDPNGNFPELAFDSFVTVGGDCSGNSLEQAVGLEFSAFNSGGGLDDDNGIVVLTPDEPQGFAGADGRVLIAQLTSRDGSPPEGQVNLAGFNSDGSEFLAYAMTWGDPALVDCNGNGQQDALDIGEGLSLDCNVDGIPDDCQTSNPNRDCNDNGTPDWCDITAGTSEDGNNNGVPDECECEGDLNGDSLVNVDDILLVILGWGEPGGAGDANGDGIVDALDLSLVITAYGGCL